MTITAAWSTVGHDIGVEILTLMIITVIILVAMTTTLPFPPVESIVRLMTVWRITGKIINQSINQSSLFQTETSIEHR